MSEEYVLSSDLDISPPHKIVKSRKKIAGAKINGYPVEHVDRAFIAPFKLRLSSDKKHYSIPSEVRRKVKAKFRNAQTFHCLFGR